jgi:hypothetical protein
MSAEAELGVPGPSRLDKGKGKAMHIRHASIDENLLSAEHMRTSSSPFPSSQMQNTWSPTNPTARHHFPNERRSSETVFSQQSPQSASSARVNNQAPGTPVEAISSANADRERESSNVRLGEEDESVHVKEKVKKHHHRRLSSKSHASPGRSFNPLDHAAQSPEDPARGKSS